MVECRSIKYHMAQPMFPETEIAGILRGCEAILRGDQPLSQGPRVREFEEQFAAYVGTKFAVAMNCCSAALEIALRSLDLRGGEVIVPAETFIATGASVMREGGVPVFADVASDTFCLSATTVEARLTPQTRAVILVHMAGLVTPETGAIRALCRAHGLMLIEDAAHAPGATLDGIKAGNLGDVGCFSFYPTKIMTCAEGGMLVTNDATLYQRANSWRHRGRDLQATDECYSALGTNNRMSELHALLGLSQLRCLEDFLARRNAVAAMYHESLARLEQRGLVQRLPAPSRGRHAYWRYLLRLDPRIDRVRLRERMAERGVAVDWAYDPPLHLQPVFQRLLGTTPGLLPQTEQLMRHFICLPIHPGLQPDDARTIAAALEEALATL